MAAIERLVQVPLRELWKHEERGFSAWLESNLEVLSDAMGLSLSDAQRESPAGSFQVDLVATDGEGHRVIVENQLESTNHDHLGKLITYLTSLDAKKAVWISSDPRPEHVRAVEWLNETAPDDVAFYLIKLSAFRIAGSPPAPLFTVVVGPTGEGKTLGKQKKALAKELAERHVLRLRFWEQLLARAREKRVMYHSQRSPTKDSWLAAGAGVRSGVAFVYVIWMDEDAAVELSISTGDRDQNKSIFDALLLRKDEIEMGFGGPLTWERLDDRDASRVRHFVQKGGLKSGEANWRGIHDEMIDAMDRLAKAIKPYFSKL